MVTICWVRSSWLPNVSVVAVELTPATIRMRHAYTFVWNKGSDDYHNLFLTIGINVNQWIVRYVSIAI